MEDEPTTIDLQPGSNPEDEYDQLPSDEKIALLEEANLSTWSDVECGVCGKRCCSPCTAGGDISRCAQTRFRECSVCGHASSAHYRVDH